MEKRRLEELLEAVQKSDRNDLHTAMPGTVIAYNAARNTVDVQPQLYPSLPDLDGDLLDEALPTIPDVPISWPQGGGCSITWPLAKGDHVLLVFCEQDLGLWRANGQAAGTGDVRRHGLAGAVAVPGIRTAAGALSSGVVASDAITLAPKVLLGSATAAQAMVLGNLFKAAFDAHVHPTAFGPSGIPTPLTGVLSTKHKLDS